MCLIVYQTKDDILSDELLRDIYTRNSDGLGMMYAEDGELVVHKFLPKTAAEFIAAYQKHGEGRELLLHARMTTHGETDLANCHPYEVAPGIALMHNGVLSMGNSWDTKKSDTWHFVERVISPAVTYDPALIHDPSWQSYIGSIIGSSNRFALMDRHGQVAIINRQTGVEAHDRWYSNTYAWPASDYGVKTTSYYGNWSSRFRSSYDYDSWPSRFLDSGKKDDAAQDAAQDAAPRETVALVPGKKVKLKLKPTSTPSMLQIWRAARNSYQRDRLLDWIHAAPEKAQAFLLAVEPDRALLRDLALTDPATAAVMIEAYFDRDGACPGEVQS